MPDSTVGPVGELGRMSDVSIVLPCLNERQALGHCLDSARQALDIIAARHGLSGEIVVADNGSTDGSRDLAISIGARLVDVPVPGYGAALRGGLASAEGRFLVMGDADGSYDFREAVPMVEALLDGADICMGSRFKGGIAPGAMPWMNRYIGNPILTGLLNLLFHCKVDDAHCGLRALTKPCFERLRLDGSGMEFASEMLLKAVLLEQRIAEVGVTLRPDRRGRPPHLRPWRDGWRHLRYLLMLSPFWLFGLPATDCRFGRAVDNDGGCCIDGRRGHALRQLLGGAGGLRADPRAYGHRPRLGRPTLRHPRTLSPASGWLAPLAHGSPWNRCCSRASLRCWPASSF